jgi:hypothetical protein
MEYQCSATNLQPGLFSNPNITFSSVPAGNAQSGHCARRLSETAERTGRARSEKFNALTSSTLATRLSATRCLDAAKYANGTQVSCSLRGGGAGPWEAVSRVACLKV